VQPSKTRSLFTVATSLAPGEIGDDADFETLAEWDRIADVSTKQAIEAEIG